MTTPSEVYPPDATINALAGTTETDTGFAYLTIAEAPYYTTELKEQYRNQQLLAAVAGLRVADEGGVTFGVYPGKFFDGLSLRSYGGATGESLTDSATNYVYLTAAATLTVNTTGFPEQASTPHLKLATIVCASGDITSMTDHRNEHVFAVPRQISRRTITVPWGSDYATKKTITVPAGIGLRAGVVRSVKAYCGAAVTADDGESLAIDVTLSGTSCLDAAFSLADGDAADTVKSATIDTDNDDVAADDRIEIALTYTADTANTLDDVLVQIEIEQLA